MCMCHICVLVSVWHAVCAVGYVYLLVFLQFYCFLLQLFAFRSLCFSLTFCYVYGVCIFGYFTPPYPHHLRPHCPPYSQPRACTLLGKRATCTPVNECVTARIPWCVLFIGRSLCTLLCTCTHGVVRICITRSQLATTNIKHIPHLVVAGLGVAILATPSPRTRHMAIPHVVWVTSNSNIPTWDLIGISTLACTGHIQLAKHAQYFGPNNLTSTNNNVRLHHQYSVFIPVATLSQ